MATVLREWEYIEGTNLPLVGATVRARAASLTFPNAGAVVASTATDANGMWEFTDATLSFSTAYDVEIEYNGRFRHRKGLSMFSNALTAANFAAQTANRVIAGPASGAAAVPTFRALVDADIPATQSTLKTFSAGITVSGGPLTVTSQRVKHARGADVASVNQLTLGTDGNFFNVTGTTQVNLISVANWQSGSVLYLRFTGILVLKYNQAASGDFKPIITISKADVTTAVNDVFAFITDGNFWYQF